MGSSPGEKRATTRPIAAELAADRVAMNNAQLTHDLHKLLVQAEVD